MWASSAIRFQKFGTEQVDFRQLVAGLMSKLSLEESDLFWVICWQIWLQRNTVLHRGVFQHPSWSHQRALDYLREFVDAQDQLSVPVSVRVPTSQAWQPPQGEFFKLNFDGACFDNGATSGYSAVIRNGNGEVMAAVSAKGGAVRDSEELEVMACCKALEFAIDTSFMEVILEGDNALVMKTVSQAQPNFSRLELIYEDIWYLVAGFRSISVSCVRHSANGVAHALVNLLGYLLMKLYGWRRILPLVVDALYLDSSLLN